MLDNNYGSAEDRNKTSNVFSAKTGRHAFVLHVLGNEKLQIRTWLEPTKINQDT